MFIIIVNDPMIELIEVYVPSDSVDKSCSSPSDSDDKSCLSSSDSVDKSCSSPSDSVDNSYVSSTDEVACDCVIVVYLSLDR